MIITENALVSMLRERGALIHTRSFSNMETFDITNMKHNIYVFTGYDFIINEFINEILPHINMPFVFVAIESDVIKFDPRLLNHPLLHRMYSWNVDVIHPKLTGIPIGLNYNRQYVSFEEFTKKKPIKPFEEKKQMILVNFSPDTNPGRASLYNHGKEHWKSYATFIPSIPFIKTYKTKSYIEGQLNVQVSNPLFYSIANDYRFILSPPGAGLDCHRHWEALALGAIPIMLSSKLDPLFQDLPVCIVDKWEDINEEFLNNISNKIIEGATTYNMEKMTLDYWVNRIASF